MTDNQCQCNNCYGVFDKEWSDEEAMAEYTAAAFDPLPRAKLAVVCDDCYQQMLPVKHPDKVAESNEYYRGTE